jgi:uncharacterized protein
MQLMSNALVIFAKDPNAEKVKTRVAKDTGQPKARTIYKAILTKLLKQHENTKYDTFVKLRGDTSFFKQFKINIVDDTPGGLGAKLLKAFEDYLVGHEKLAVIGSDLPAITKEDVQDAFDALDSADVVLGPATDGGYWLVAMKEANNIFTLERYSHNKVLEETLSLCQNQGLSVRLLDERSDIDTLFDVKEYIAKGILSADLL